MAMRALEVRPEIMVLEQVLDQVASGRLLVPDFQRPFSWSPSQMLELFESVERGYPIGTLLIWETPVEVPSRDRVGDFAVPSPADATFRTYLLDGQQRVSTLLNALRRPPGAPNTLDRRDWQWWVYRDMAIAPGSDANPYRHRKGAAPEPADMPVRCLLRTGDFLDWCRSLETRIVDKAKYAEIVRWAEEVAGQYKRHAVNVMRLISDDLGQAVEVFSRTNRAGEDIKPDEMVSALTYRKAGDKTLAARIDELIDDLAQTGFDAVDRTVVLRTILAVSGQDDVMSANWGKAAQSLKETMPSAVPQTRDAMLQAVDFLRDRLKLPGVKFLPYAQQLLLLTFLFHRCPKAVAQQLDDLETWFWITSWSGAFASVSPGAMRRKIAEMRDFAEGKPLKFDENLRVQPFPEKFVFASARTKAYALWEIKTFPNRLDAFGMEIDLNRRFMTDGGSAYKPIVPVGRSPLSASPANRIVLPTPLQRKPMEMLRNIPPASKNAVFSSHGITQSAWDRLSEGNYDGFIGAREDLMREKLKAFLFTLGVSTELSLVGDAEPDTDLM